MQEGCPDEYASRALTAKEENYAHIEKDELAICVAMERLHAYVYARHVAIEIDHKLLIAIANKSLASALRDNKESVSLATIQLRLDIYAGSNVVMADSLSRAYPPHKPGETNTEFPSEIRGHDG